MSVVSELLVLWNGQWTNAWGLAKLHINGDIVRQCEGDSLYLQTLLQSQTWRHRNWGIAELLSFLQNPIPFDFSYLLLPFSEIFPSLLLLWHCLWEGNLCTWICLMAWPLLGSKNVFSGVLPCNNIDVLLLFLTGLLCALWMSQVVMRHLMFALGWTLHLDILSWHLPCIGNRSAPLILFLVATIRCCAGNGYSLRKSMELWKIMIEQFWRWALCMCVLALCCLFSS